MQISIEPNTIVEISALKPGDRFYRVGDKKQIVYEKIEHSVHKTYYQTYRNWCIERTIADSPNMKSDAKIYFAKPMKPSTQVVFLRHNEQ